MQPKKRFGQNFLIDQGVLQQILAAGDLSSADTVLEIGIGTGILTKELASRAGQVIGIEIDRELFPATQQKLEQHLNVDLVLGDFLKKAEELFNRIAEYKKIKVVANIPYYITTPILEKLFLYRDKLDSIVLMVQKEVAERICAVPRTKAYGSLTLFVQYYAEPELICTVPPEAFDPPPQVWSQVIRLKIRHAPQYFVKNEERLFKIIRAAFWGRRKTLSNCLKMAPQTHYTKEVIARMAAETGIDLIRRGETLSLEEFVKLANV